MTKRCMKFRCEMLRDKRRAVAGTAWAAAGNGGAVSRARDTLTYLTGGRVAQITKETVGERAPTRPAYDATRHGGLLLPLGSFGRTMNAHTYPDGTERELSTSLFLTFSTPRHSPATRSNTQPPHGGDPASHRGGWLGWCGGGWWYHYRTNQPTNRAVGTGAVA